jgi:hypothetical protein
MGRRLQARRGNGRFTPNTPENTLGMHFNIHGFRADGTTWCGAFNPSRVGEDRPIHCHACGDRLEDAPNGERS